MLTFINEIYTNWQSLVPQNPLKVEGNNSIKFISEIKYILAIIIHEYRYDNADTTRHRYETRKFWKKDSIRHKTWLIKYYDSFINIILFIFRCITIYCEVIQSLINIHLNSYYLMLDKKNINQIKHSVVSNIWSNIVHYLHE